MDALISPADPELVHDIGISKQIADCGGKTIDDESNAWYENNGFNDAKIGDVVVTSGGKLSCKYVIHTVIPQVKQTFPTKSSKKRMIYHLLKKCIANSLDKANDLGNVKSISMPLLGS